MQLYQLAQSLAKDGVRQNLSSKALEFWRLNALDTTKSKNTIRILAPIGESYENGVTANDVFDQLIEIGETSPVHLLINSPGGSMFEGIAIMNLLKEHKAEVTIDVVGIAASAASVIAMGASPGKLRIAQSGSLMIHNSWSLVVGNRHVLAEAAERMAVFDKLMAELYAERSGIEVEQVTDYMNAETYFTGKEAVDLALADSLLTDNKTSGSKPEIAASAAVINAGIPGATSMRGVTMAEQAKETAPKITSEYLAANYPDLLNQIKAEALQGVDSSIDEAKAVARAEGAKAELERIQAVESAALPGHEKLINELKFDGKTTGAEAALKVIAAEKAAGKSHLASIQARPEPVPASAEVPAASVDESLPIEQRCEAKWEKDASLRAEFGSLDAYLAYEKANTNNQVKILGGKH